MEATVKIPFRFIQNRFALSPISLTSKRKTLKKKLDCYLIWKPQWKYHSVPNEIVLLCHQFHWFSMCTFTTYYFNFYTLQIFGMIHIWFHICVKIEDTCEEWTLKIQYRLHQIEKWNDSKREELVFRGIAEPIGKGMRETCCMQPIADHHSRDSKFEINGYVLYIV